MIGWWIVIAQQTPAERDASPDKKAANLANWQAGIGGIDWLERLSKEGKANKLSGSGYPTRYTAIARDVLPLIVGGPPPHPAQVVLPGDCVMPGDWTDNVVIDYAKVAACPTNQILTIDAWDQS